MQTEDHGRPLHVFFSFAPEDRKFRDDLEKHLRSLRRAGLIDDWHEHKILAGSEWQDAVNERLEQADIILLFITPEYIASNYCYSVQMPKALKKHDEGIARVIPIFFRYTACYNPDLPFTKLQGLPSSGHEPVSEWKSKDKAYVEIVKGITRVIEDFGGRRALAAQSASQVWNVPYKRNPFFMGRDDLLSSLRQGFQTERDYAIVTQAISGMGGIGKTQVALEYAYRYRDDYYAVFWLSGESAEDLVSGFLGLATLLNLHEQNETEQQIVITAVKRALEQAPRWLMIIDNLEAFEQFDELVPVRGRGDLLITTRRQATGTTAVLKEVEQMTPEQGALFLLRRGKVIEPDATLDGQPDTLVAEARTVCQLVDGLPLALDQAGAYIEETKTGVSRYIDLYQKHRATLLKQRRRFTTGHPASVTTTLTLCVEQARQHNPALVELLQACAFLQPDAIPVALFTTGANELGATLQALCADELELDGALETLLDLSLIRRNSDTETISLHRLVQEIVRDGMKANEQRTWARRVIKALYRLFPEPESGVWPECQQYLPHALLAGELVKRWNLSFAEAALLLRRAGRYLYTIASYDEARKLCEQALAIDERVYKKRPETARTLHCLGNIAETKGDYTKAEHYYERARAIFEDTLKPEDPETAEVLNDLGELSQTVGKLALAEEYYRKALDMRQEAFGLNHPATAGSLNNLAGICEERGQYDRAEALYEQALHIRERLRGSNHPDTAESLSNLARFYRVVGRYAQARPLYERALAAYEQAFGPEHPRVATCCNNFGVFCLDTGQYEQAEQLLTRAIEIRTRLLGPEHPSVAGSQNHLARVYSKQGRYEQARALYEHALAVSEQALGREHAGTVAILINMGELFWRQGDDHGAETLLREALASLGDGQDGRPLRAASALNLLGEIYLARGEDEQAERFWREALDIMLAALGEGHPGVLELVERLTGLLEKMGRAEEARALAERVSRQMPS